MNLNGAGIVNYYCLVQGHGGDDATPNDGNNGLIINGYHGIKIPYYQRPYKWGDKDRSNIRDLFYDYNCNTNMNHNVVSDYFLGATVAVEKITDGVNYFELVDGQQRLTTIFLMNYILFMLKRKEIDHKIKSRIEPGQWKDDIKQLEKIYHQRIGIHKDIEFENIIEFITNAYNQLFSSEISQEEFFNSVLNEYRQKLGIVNHNYNTEEELDVAYRNLTYSFFRNEQLAITYRRESFNNNLKAVLASTKIEINENPIDISLGFADEIDKKSLKATYQCALQMIFEEVKSYVELNLLEAGNSNVWDRVNLMIEYLNDMIKHLNLCMITTIDENDAYKLFEVLNDRSFEVSSLDLLKNHFYMIYYSKNSALDNNDIDANMDELDKIWSEKVFKGIEPNKHKLIAYLGLVYLTQDSNLDDNDALFKHSLETKYTQSLASYSIEVAKHDFNIFRAISIILEKFGFKYNGMDKETKKVIVNPQNSITYKTAVMLHSMKRPAILAALINVILSFYENTNNDRLCYDATDEMTSFKNFVDDLKTNNNNYILIHQVAFKLWKSNLLASTYKTPREEIAKKIIENYGSHQYNNAAVYYSDDTVNKLMTEFDTWFINWKKGHDDLRAAILLIELFQCNKLTNNNVVTLVPGANTYNFHGDEINIDHLEPDNIDEANRNNYYCSGSDNDSKIKRNKVINTFGNMMILDKVPNIQKGNDPLLAGISTYYTQLYNNHWMLLEIQDMSLNNQFFDGSIPKDVFFDERARRIRLYLKKLLSRNSYTDICDISEIISN